MMKDVKCLSNNEGKRTFIAINLDSNIKNALFEFQTKIIVEDSRIKWIHPNLLHITLEFLGNQSQKEIENIYLLLKKITSHQKAFVICLSSNIGVFPSLKKPRIIWAGIEEGSAELKKLSKSIKYSLLKNNLLYDSKEFRTHITIGRVKYLPDKNTLMDSLNVLNIKKQSQKINSIELMESTLTPTGPIYSKLYSFPLVHF